MRSDLTLSVLNFWIFPIPIFRVLIIPMLATAISEMQNARTIVFIDFICKTYLQSR